MSRRQSSIAQLGPATVLQFDIANPHSFFGTLAWSAKKPPTLGSVLHTAPSDRNPFPGLFVCFSIQSNRILPAWRQADHALTKQGWRRVVGPDSNPALPGRTADWESCPPQSPPRLR